jgi:carbon storage regulator CsrA
VSRTREHQRERHLLHTVNQGGLEMLVITRRTESGFVIDTSDGPIRIIVIRITGGNVRLGIDAPKHCEVLRDELLLDRDGTDAPATDGH